MTSTDTHYVQSTTKSAKEHNSQLSIVNYQFAKDTTYVIDSVRLETRNDTVYHMRWRTEFRDRVVHHADTLLYSDTMQIAVRDTIRLETTIPCVTSKEPDVPSWCWKLLIGNIIVVLLWIGRKIYKFKFN